MSFDLNAVFDDPRFAEAVALFGATGQHNAGLIDAAKTMQHMKQLKAQQEQTQWEREHARKKLSLEQSEHESMKGYRAGQIEAQSAQTVTSRLNAEQLRRQNDAIDAKQKQKAAFLRSLAKDPRFSKFAPALGGLAGEQEGEQPVAPSAISQSAPMSPQPAPMPVQAPALEVPRGKYGTPVAILDGLAKTESSNNPIAIGPVIGYENGKPIRAEGMFQFLPSTRKMLAAEGVNFDPFKPLEARNAADYYLAKLNKQHGGDWNKTLAAYGGFKTKDPTNYIQKVMGGSNEKQAIAHAASQNATQVVNPFAESQELQQLAGILTFVDEDLGKGFEIMSKGAQPQKVEGGGMYQTPGGMVRVPLTPEQQAEEARKKAEHGWKANDEAHKVRTRPIEVQQAQANVADTQATTDKKNADAAEKALELRNRKAKEAAGHQTNVQTINRTQEAIKRLLDNKNLSSVTGQAAWIPKGVAATISTDRGNTIADLDQVVGAMTMDTLQDMRKNAPTGASGLGQFQKFESDIMTAMQGLDRSRSAESIKESLKTVNEILETYKRTSADVYKGTYGEDVPMPPAQKKERTVIRRYKGAKSGKEVIEYSDGTTEYGS